MVDKNQAIIDFLMECPQIANSSLFFNFIDAQDKDKQLVTVATDKMIERPYIDGSVLKRYTFTLIDFRSVVNQALVSSAGYVNENVEEMLDVQGIMEWIEEQNDLRNYPNFGTDTSIDDMHCTTDIPNLNGVDTNVTPALAKYSISIQVNYLDKSKMIWS